MTEHMANTRPRLMPGAQGSGTSISAFGPVFAGPSGTQRASLLAALRMCVVGRIGLACRKWQTKLRSQANDCKAIS